MQDANEMYADQYDASQIRAERRADEREAAAGVERDLALKCEGALVEIVREMAEHEQALLRIGAMVKEGKNGLAAASLLGLFKVELNDYVTRCLND